MLCCLDAGNSETLSEELVWVWKSGNEDSSCLRGEKTRLLTPVDTLTLPPTCLLPPQLLVFILPIFSPSHSFPSFPGSFPVSAFAFLLSWFLFIFSFFFIWVTPTKKFSPWASHFICDSSPMKGSQSQLGRSSVTLSVWGVVQWCGCWHGWKQMILLGDPTGDKGPVWMS